MIDIGTCAAASAAAGEKNDCVVVALATMFKQAIEEGVL